MTTSTSRDNYYQRALSRLPKRMVLTRVSISDFKKVMTIVTLLLLHSWTTISSIMRNIFLPNSYSFLPPIPDHISHSLAIIVPVICFVTKHKESIFQPSPLLCSDTAAADEQDQTSSSQFDCPLVVSAKS